MAEQTLANQTLYAQLLDLLGALDAQRSIGHLAGTFVPKEIHGQTYIYFQYSVPGGVKRQVFVGRKDEVLDRLIDRHRHLRIDYGKELEQVQRLCAQLRAGEAMTTDATTARVVGHLAESGVFRIGGVLIGTHAFAVLGNVLGVRWDSHASTEDIDIATSLRVALPDVEVDLPEALERLKMGFLPVPALDPRQAATSFKVRGRSLRVELLIPERSRRSEGLEPVFVPALKACAQPLRYLDYLLDDAQRAVLIDGGGVLVNVPDPARFAFHKLIISTQRPVAFQTKSTKDIGQAAQLLHVLCRNRPGDVTIAWEEVRRRRWTRHVAEGLKLLRADHEKAFSRVTELVRTDR